AIFDSVQEDGQINTADIAEAVFKGNISAKQAYQEVIADKEIETEIAVPNVERYEKKYRLQRFKLDSGIEIAIPMDIYQDRSKVEFVNNPDGTMSLVIKDIESIVNKFTS
ncbi:MAG: nucleoid-associated protein, partial [Weissella cibaria]